MRSANTASTIAVRPLGSTRQRALGAVYVVVLHAVLLAGVAVAATPFVWMISASFKMQGEIFGPITFIPREPTVVNYHRLVTELPFARFFANSMIIALAETSLRLFFASLAGFAFAKYQFRLQKLLMGIIVATMMVPFQVLLVPLFLLVLKLGLLNTYYGIIIPGAVTAFGIFWMRQYMMTVPSELLDAGRIDGCSEFGIFARIAVPLARPALGVLAILDFMRSWNDFLWPLIVLRTRDMYTVPLGLAGLVGLYKVEYGQIMAGAFLGTLPIIILFMLMSRQFIAGLTAGALKG